MNYIEYDLKVVTDNMAIMKIGSFIFLLLLNNCSSSSDDTSSFDSKTIRFGKPQKVNVLNYNEDIMEPFLADDGKTLFFNNSNHPLVNTNLHFAVKINDSTFQYRGELKGVNTEYLDGNATMDSAGVFFFVSTRSYDQTLSTIYKGIFTGDSISKIQLLKNVSRNQAGWVNFDCEISKDGNVLFSVDGRFDQNGGPYESNFISVIKRNHVFQRSDDTIFKNINTNALEYAACLSSDILELYFTRVEAPLSDLSMPQIYVAIRNSVNEPFHNPYKLETVTGFVEGPSISPDNQIIYYHKKENGKFLLYMVRKI